MASENNDESAAEEEAACGVNARAKHIVSPKTLRSISRQLDDAARDFGAWAQVMDDNHQATIEVGSWDSLSGTQGALHKLETFRRASQKVIRELDFSDVRKVKNEMG